MVQINRWSQTFTPIEDIRPAYVKTTHIMIIKFPIEGEQWLSPDECGTIGKWKVDSVPLSYLL